MEIEIGKCYQNKTWRFLVPCLRGHGDIFVRKFNPVHKLATGIHDTLLDDSPLANGRSIYLLCDKLVNPNEFNSFLDWIKFQPYYVADYCPDSELLKSRKHMIILNVPDIFNEAYDHFLKGEYSVMYLENEIKTLFSNTARKRELDILSRTPEVIKEFTDTINEEFKTSGDTKPTTADFRTAELELPLKKSEEIFNYKDNDSIFFNDKIDKIWQL